MMKKFKIKNSKFKIFILLLFSVYCLLSTVFACSPQKEKVYRKSKVLMDTLITISVVSGSGDKAEKAIEMAFSEIEKLDRLLNFFSDSSEVSEINRNAG